jgi:hypothetical protein
MDKKDYIWLVMGKTKVDVVSGQHKGSVGTVTELDCLTEGSFILETADQREIKVFSSEIALAEPRP